MASVKLVKFHPWVPLPLRVLNYFVPLLASESGYLSISDYNSVIAIERGAGIGGQKMKNLIKAKHPQFTANHSHMTEYFSSFFPFCRNYLKPPVLGHPLSPLRMYPVSSLKYTVLL